MADELGERYMKSLEHTKRGSMAEPRDKYNRREFLRKVGRAAKLTAAGAVFGPLTGLSTLDLVDTAGSIADYLKAPHTPSEVYRGEIEVKRGVNIRLAPFVPDPREEPNTVNWDDIRLAPSAADKDFGLYKKESFKMENPLIYTRKDGSRWIMWDAFLLRNVLTQPTTFFINVGPETADFVKLLPGGEFVKIADLKNRQPTHVTVSK